MPENALKEHHQRVARTAISHLLSGVIFVVGAFVWFSYRTAITLFIVNADLYWLSRSLMEIIAFILYGVALLITTLIGQYIIERQLNAGQRIPKFLLSSVGAELGILVLSKITVGMFS